jgi:hypothetical protein
MIFCFFYGLKEPVQDLEDAREACLFETLNFGLSFSELMFCAVSLVAVGWLLYVIFPSAFTDLYRLFAKASGVNKLPNANTAIVAKRFQFKLTNLFITVPNIRG